MKKKNYIIIALIFLIFILIGSAYSKYFKIINAIGHAEVAKWSFKVNGSSNETQTFDLALTINQNTSIIENQVAPRD